MGCLDCCTRLVMSAWPHRKPAAALMACIERYRGAPIKAAVVQSVAAAVKRIGGANAV